MSVSRRKFIQQASVAGSFFIVPRHVLGRGFIAPSDKLNIAAVGAGGKGASDIFNASNNGKNNVVALCDIDWRQAAKSIERFPKAAQYQDFRLMLEKEKSIDAITISTPDHTHATIAMAAMQLGKHVYVQKPLTHNIFEARTLTKAANQYKIVTQMGNQGASGAGTKQFVKWFEEGKIGKVHTLHIFTNRPVWPQGIPIPKNKVEVPKDLAWDLFIGPASPVEYHPGYHPFKWRGWWNFGTGALGDMGCHLFDAPFRALGLGYPTEVECSVGAVYTRDWTPEWIPEGCPPSSVVQLKFDKTKKNDVPVTMTWADGGIRPFHHEWIPADETLSNSGSGVMMVGEKGVMLCEEYGNNPRIFMKGGEKLTMKWQEEAMPENGHQFAWTEACKAGFGSKEQKALVSNFDFAGPLTESILMGNLAIRSYEMRNAKNEQDGRKKLLWDGANMRITNFDAANQFVKREYRAGWSL
jgi:predicted dehydrogenase